MLLLLPVLSFILFYAILRAKQTEWRAAILGAAVFWGTAVVVLTEGLSIPRLISRGPLAMTWLLVCAISLFYLRKLRGPVPSAANSPEPAPEKLDGASKAFLSIAVVYLLLVGAIAVIAAPSVWDAMEYHLPRAMLWMSHHSVRFYPTPDFNQLVLAPWSEFAMMHTYLLWGSDRFVNFVQFFSFVGCVLAASLIAKKLGAGLRGQVLAAVASVTIPEGLLEASGPMNTYVVAFWIAVTVYFLLEWNSNPTWTNTSCIGLSAGLAILTKGTAYSCLPFLVVGCWWLAPRERKILFAKRSPAILALLLAVNLGQFARNVELTKSPLGLPTPISYPRLEVRIAHVTPQRTAANLLRNLSLHAGSPSDALNGHIEGVFRAAMRGIGADPDDPEAIWVQDRFHINKMTLNEIVAGDPIHLALILLAIAGLVWARARGWKDPALAYAAGLCSAYVLFSALLRWQMWSSRYQLPFFVLGAALIGVTFEKYLSRKIGFFISGILLLVAAPFVLLNRARSLVPWSRVETVYHSRNRLYFNDQHAEAADINIAAAGAVNRSSCERVAFDSYVKNPSVGHSSRSFFVYPLLAMIHADGRGRTAEYTGVENPTTRYETPPTQPCAVICLDCANVPEKWAAYRDIGGRASVFGYIVIFSAEGQIQNDGLPVVAPTSPR